MDRFGGLIWSVARRYCPTAAEAEDAVQEIFIDLWKSAGRYDASIASETTFVAMIARRRLIDRNRRRARRPESAMIPESVAAPMAEAGVPSIVEEDARIAAEALAQLRPEQQRVLQLSIFHGASHEQISRSTGLPLGTVKTHARRGLIRIRELLEARKAARSGSDGPARATGAASAASPSTRMDGTGALPASGRGREGPGQDASVRENQARERGGSHGAAPSSHHGARGAGGGGSEGRP